MDETIEFFYISEFDWNILAIAKPPKQEELIFFQLRVQQKTNNWPKGLDRYISYFKMNFNVLTQNQVFETIFGGKY